jgi:hypothetical protein
LSGFPGRTKQVYSVAYSLARAPATFLPLATVDGTLTNNNESQQEVQVSISGIGLSGVAAVQFTFGSGTLGDVVYREIDINVPEPSSALLLAAAGASALYGRRSRRGHKA